VTVTTSDPTVASVAGAVVVAAGGQLADLPLTTGSGGTATLTIEAAGVRRELTIVVGSAPTPGTTPPIVAAPVGVTVIPNPSIGRVFGQLGAPSAATLGIPLLSAPAAAGTAVTTHQQQPVGRELRRRGNDGHFDRGGRAGTAAAGVHLGHIGRRPAHARVHGVRRELVVVVGDPPASQIPAVTAPIVGVQVKP